MEGPKVIQKRVQIIMNCSCQSCDKDRKEDCEITDENTLELPQNLFIDERNTSDSNSDDLPELLKAPSQNDTDNAIHNTETNVKFKNKIKKLFEIYQNQTEDVKNDDLQKYLETYGVDLEHNRENNLKIEKDLESLPADFGIEGMPSHHRGSQHNQNDIMENDVIKKHHETKSGGHHGHHGYHHGEGHHLHHLGEEQHIGND